MTRDGNSVRLDLSEALAQQAAAGVQVLVEGSFASRLFERDSSLWGPDASAEASIRLNWISAIESAEPLVEEVETFRDFLASQGLTDFILCGMGGSSLGPEMLARWAHKKLIVVDSTHPEVVARAADDLSRSVLVVSSKSGTTVETRSHLAFFEAQYRAAGIDPSSRVVVVTDPGSALAEYAERSGYRVFLADPHVGGRFSIFTAFGVVPAVLAGVDFREVLRSARAVREELAADSVSNPALQLASAAIVNEARLELGEKYFEFGLGDWIEQLVAESTGKHGQGVLPVIVPGQSGFPIAVTAELGAELLTWMVATAAMGALLGVNPFDQPDVERAKQAARAVLSEAHDSRSSSVSAAGQLDAQEIVRALGEARSAPSYIGLQIFGDPQREGDAALELQSELMNRFGVPVTVGWGPRFLHSTGQLHKGGPMNATFIQLLPKLLSDIDIPEQQHTFGELISSQALGDARVLDEVGQRVLRSEASTADVLAALRAH